MPHVSSPASLTTGQFAKLLALDRSSVRRWIEAGVLEAVRPEGELFERPMQYRIPVETALAFARARGIETEALRAYGRACGVLDRTPLILWCSPTWPEGDLVALGGCGPVTAVTGLCALTEAALQQRFDVLVLDASVGREFVHEALRWLRGRRPNMRLGVLAAEDDPRPQDWLLAGAHRAERQPVDLAGFVRRLLAGSSVCVKCG